MSIVGKGVGGHGCTPIARVCHEIFAVSHHNPAGGSEDARDLGLGYSFCRVLRIILPITKGLGIWIFDYLHFLPYHG